MSDNVTRFPTRGERIFAELAANKKEWIEDTIGLCTALVEARADFATHADFTRWLKDEGITINAQDRAAAIKMGRKPDVLRECSETTTWWTLRGIYKEYKDRF